MAEGWQARAGRAVVQFSMEQLYGAVQHGEGAIRNGIVAILCDVRAIAVCHGCRVQPRSEYAAGHAKMQQGMVRRGRAEMASGHWQQ